MEFGNSIFLWGLLAIPLPLLLHLFFRRRKASIAFSTLQFFHQRKRYLAHRRRLREDDAFAQRQREKGREGRGGRA